MKETIDIVAPPEIVWEYLRSPAAMASWNANVRDARDTPFVLGRTYDISYLMSGKKQAARGVVERCDPPLRKVPGDLVLKIRSLDEKQNRFAIESYKLLPTESGTRLTMDIDLSAAGMPWWARALIGFIRLTGEPVGKPFLDRLRELAELDARTHPSSTPRQVASRYNRCNNWARGETWP